MNKKDVLGIMEVVASDNYFKDFKIRKSDNSIILISDMGYKRVQFQYYNTYDLKREELALEITPNYEIRFNILHKWFEKYCKKTIKDQRDHYSIGFVGSMLGEISEFCFLENRNDYCKDLQLLNSEVVKNAKRVFEKFSTLKAYYDYYINDVIRGKRNFPGVTFDWIVEYLIATKIVSPSNYELVKKLILEKVELMMGQNNPDVERYYNDLPMILEDLEATDFTSGKWGKIPL